MTEKVIAEFLNVGIAGAIIIVLIAYIRHLTREHSKERFEWRTESNGHIDRFVEVIKDNTEALTVIHGKMKGQKETLERIEKKVP